ncbi:C-signal-like [Glandiceps talaboti]
MASTFKVKCVVITGTDRGIGLEMVKQFTKLPNPPDSVFACALSDDTTSELRKLAEDNKSVTVIKMDVTNVNDIDEAAKYVEQQVGENGVNLLVNNAGIMILDDKLKDVDSESMMQQFRVNAIGPAMVTKRFLPLLRRASNFVQGEQLCASRASVFNISSKMASLADNRSGSDYGYRCSKMALNMVTKNLSLELSPDCILCVLLHPGWVKTDMGTAGAFHSVEESVEGLIDVMATRSNEHNGLFYDFKGILIPW